MMRRMFAAAVLAATAVAPAAAAEFTITLNADAGEIADNNYFGQILEDAGLGSFASGSAVSLAISGPAAVDFFYLGSESGYYNKFTASSGSQSVSWQETSPDYSSWPLNDVENLIASPAALAAALAGPGAPAVGYQFGSLYYPGSVNLTDWLFSSNVAGSSAAGYGDEGFGLFMLGSPTAGTFGSQWVLLGYDDQDGGQLDDDNHDDFLVLARISAVPEAGTWAMLLAGFATVGAALRRGRRHRMVQAV